MAPAAEWPLLADTGRIGGGLSRRLNRSIALDLRVLDELRERGVVVAVQPVELLRRAGTRRHAMLGEQLAHRLFRQDLAEGGVVFRDDVRRRAGGAPGREPGEVVEVPDALLVQR